MARAFSLPVRRILLYPLGGFSEIEQEPPTPAREFLVSGAGPLLSLLLAALGFGIVTVFGAGRHSADPDRSAGPGQPLVGILNLLPGLPLDGGRMLRAGVWKADRQAGHRHDRRGLGRAGSRRGAAGRAARR